MRSLAQSLKTAPLITLLLSVTTSVGDTAESSKGEQLARVHCASCHSFPEPTILPKRSWNFLLGYMGLRMGMGEISFPEGATPEEVEILMNRKALIELEGASLPKPMVTDEDWGLIRDYILESAAEEPLPQKARPEVQSLNELFKPHPHGYQLKVPITSLVHIDEFNQETLLGDSGYERMTALDQNMRIKTDYETPGYLWVQALQSGNGIHLLSIGDLMGGSANKKLGKVSYGIRRGGAYANQGVALDNLHRPADMAFGDFDNDRKVELVVCNFGFGTGSVDIHKAKANGWQFEQVPAETLTTDPGAVDCEVADFNADGLPDVAVLFGGARENMSVFINLGNGRFERKTLIEKHAAFGYVRFKWVDFDGDGDLDVFTINGDNVDADPYNTLKPYHGFRLYLNEGDLNFVERYFYPMHGAYGLAVEDFDLDGDLDLAGVAFSPDFDAEKNESFVYLENTRANQFTPRSLPIPKTDRWMTIESGDLDGDGDKDLILGGGYVPAGLAIDNPNLMKAMGQRGRALLILKNQTK